MMSIQLSFQINVFPERLKSVSITAAVVVAMAVMAEPGKKRDLVTPGDLMIIAPPGSDFWAIRNFLEPNLTSLKLSATFHNSYWMQISIRLYLYIYKSQIPTCCIATVVQNTVWIIRSAACHTEFVHARGNKYAIDEALGISPPRWGFFAGDGNAIHIWFVGIRRHCTY